MGPVCPKKPENGSRNEKHPRSRCSITSTAHSGMAGPVGKPPKTPFRNRNFYSDPNARLYAYRACAADFLKDFKCDLNLVWHGGQPLSIGGLERIPPSQQWDRWREMGWDRRSIIADPAFVDASADDFRLTPGSPAFDIGFKPIPADRIGPYCAAERASWPIVEAEGAREHGYARAVPGLHRRR